MAGTVETTYWNASAILSVLGFDSNLTGVLFWKSVCQYVNIGLGNDLVGNEPL